MDEAKKLEIAQRIRSEGYWTEAEVLAAISEAVEECAKVCDARVEVMRAHVNAYGIVSGPNFYFDEIEAVEEVARVIRRSTQRSEET